MIDNIHEARVAASGGNYTAAQTYAMIAIAEELRAINERADALYGIVK